ncbi:hypothetical protein PRIPAC_72469, partial [Pristionchus pacificus]|uniref:Uncharacterized protein n=1 Tax=Pristionchus pacificus TaxID=54126 RepID=A0A2A6CGF2_PRIPA
CPLPLPSLDYSDENCPLPLPSLDYSDEKEEEKSNDEYLCSSGGISFGPSSSTESSNSSLQAARLSLPSPLPSSLRYSGAHQESQHPFSSSLLSPFSLRGAQPPLSLPFSLFDEYSGILTLPSRGLTLFISRTLSLVRQSEEGVRRGHSSPTQTLFISISVRPIRAARERTRKSCPIQYPRLADSFHSTRSLPGQRKEGRRRGFVPTQCLGASARSSSSMRETKESINESGCCGVWGSTMVEWGEGECRRVSGRSGVGLDRKGEEEECGQGKSARSGQAPALHARLLPRFLEGYDSCSEGRPALDYRRNGGKWTNKRGTRRIRYLRGVPGRDASSGRAKASSLSWKSAGGGESSLYVLIFY